MLAANYDITIDRGADYSFVLTVQNQSGVAVTLPAANLCYGDIRDSVTKQQVTSFSFTSGLTTGQLTITLGKTLTKLLRETGGYEYDIFADIGSPAVRRRLIEGKVLVRNNRTNEV